MFWTDPAHKNPDGTLIEQRMELKKSAGGDNDDICFPADCSKVDIEALFSQDLANQLNDAKANGGVRGLNVTSATASCDLLQNFISDTVRAARGV